MADGASSDSESSGSSSGDDSSQPPTELMITTRERRKTAGNRYSQVVAQEQADEDAEDDVALLFAEAEGDDEEYNSDEADDEADMSSSDDDDQGPNAGADELEGEQEIQKQAKVERQKKRKADMALTTISAIRKKPKIDPTSLHRAPDKPKPSKRKERVSWLPDNDAAPGRTSLRKQTVAHREVMLERLKENEELRLKNKAQREKKEKLKQAEAPRELTQADRLAEAARNERKNAKSLNRWEAREKERAEEQAARLAALKDRRLEGAVLTSYSAAHMYQGLRVERASPDPSAADDKPVKRKYQRRSKVIPMSQAPSDLSTAASPAQLTPNSSLAINTVPPLVGTTQPAPEPQEAKPQDENRENSEWLAGIHEYASMQAASGTPNAESDKAQPMQAQNPSIQALVPENAQNASPNHEQDGQAQSTTNEVSSIASKPSIIENPVVATPTGKKDLSQAQSNGTDKVLNTMDPSKPLMDQNDANATITTQAPTAPSVAPIEVENPDHVLPGAATGTGSQDQAPKIEVLSTRNLVVLERFDELGNDGHRDFSVFYNTKKDKKPPKASTEYCAITGQVAKYRDPISGAGYANMNAYKKLKEAQKHQFGWSSMLGCYIGRVGHVARGVPDGFSG